MTREEAIKHCLNSLANKKIEGTDIPANQLVGMLEALGLLKFEEAEKKKISLFEITANNVYWPAANLYQPDAKNLIKFNAKYGVVRLEEWPEGLVLWVDGKIVYKSWSPGS